MRGHGRNDVRVADPALKETDASPELQPFRGEYVPGQIETRQPVALEGPLICKVVDREDDGRAAELRVPGIEGFEVDRHQAGLPVV